MADERDRSNLALLTVLGVATLALAGRLAWDASRPPRAIVSAPIAARSPAESSVAQVDVSPTTRPARGLASPPAVSISPDGSPAAKASVAKKPKRPPAPSAPTPSLPASAAAPVVPLAVARSALDAVGDDPDAEAVWVAAINDPAFSPHDRSDLIEDLNENGFADPEHVTPDELPLVLARLDLIEQLAPDAMDDVNSAAFAEAYKDLSNMADRLTR